MMPSFPAWLTARVAIPIGLALLIVLVVVGGPAACNRIRSLTAQSRVDHAQSGAFTNSAGDAVETIGNANSRERSSDDLTASNDKEIRNAQGADVAVHPDADAAGLRALCRRAAYRDDPSCRLRLAPAK